MIPMKNLQQLTIEITRLTTEIEENYPELYRNLGENPLTIPNTPHPGIDLAILNDYLGSLKAMLQAQRDADRQAAHS